MQYRDVWESYQVAFTIWHSEDEPLDEMIFDGNKLGTKDIVMRRLPHETSWMTAKYGKGLTPW